MTLMIRSRAMLRALFTVGMWRLLCLRPRGGPARRRVRPCTRLAAEEAGGSIVGELRRVGRI